MSEKPDIKLPDGTMVDIKTEADEYKRRTIEAFKKIIYKYLNPTGKTFFSWKVCPLCDIHMSFNDRIACKGCPLSAEGGRWGCAAFETYKVAKDSYENPLSNDTRIVFKIRADFFKRHLETIKKWDPKRFTAEGWIYSGEEIPRSE